MRRPTADFRRKEMETYSIALSEIIKEFNLETVFAPDGFDEHMISHIEVNRPGLALAGFYNSFDSRRIQIIGNAEYQYILSLSQEMREKAIYTFIEHRSPAVIFTTSLEVFPEVKDAADIYGVPILRTAEKTSEFQAALIAYLNVQLAPRITRHGVLVEVYGEGILMLGESGVGKSETAIELVKRGHRLIADDAVEIKRVSSKTLVGSAPEVIRHYVELRGIGIVDVRRIFGMGAVKTTENIKLIINLEPWDNNKMYDRLGLENETMDILGIAVPMITIPVQPGRNLAVIIEIAAMNNRQKQMGYNTAKEFTKRVMENMQKQN